MSSGMDDSDEEFDQLGGGMDSELEKVHAHTLIYICTCVHLVGVAFVLLCCSRVKGRTTSVRQKSFLYTL